MEHLRGKDYDYDLLLNKTAKTTLEEAYLRITCFTFVGWVFDETKNCVHMQKLLTL